MIEHEQGAPPVSEEIHLPGPSVLPALIALAMILVLLGITGKYYLTAAGVLLLLVCVIRWIRDTRRDIRELPTDHS
ncbi:MAG TPA: hypothetical protein VMT10_14905 [Solirubrobacteraceae bacterium]|nr:hypothetical protein [Solirubrobacteraceae bacterium]